MLSPRFWLSLPVFLIPPSHFSPQNEELDKKYAGLLEKKWTSVIRLQKKVCEVFFFFPPQRKLVGIVVLWKVRDIGAQAVVNTEMKSVKQSNDTTVDVKY